MMTLSPDIFRANPPNLRALFVASVKNIEIEISTYCNRQCRFCPNSFLDRHSGNIQMDDALFTGIVTELGVLGWRGHVSFHRYNEPMADRAYLLRRLEECHARAPGAAVRLFTNGDYLDAPYLEAVHSAGCRAIVCSVYLPDGKEYSDSLARSLIQKKLKKLGLTFKWNASRPGYHEALATYRDLTLFVRSKDYYLPQSMMSSRGGSIPVNEAYIRTKPCLRPIEEMQIECDGTLMPCCECRSDYEGHRPAIMGRLSPGDSLVEAWGGDTYVQWRKALFKFGPKASPCHNCLAPGLADNPETRKAVAAFRAANGLD